MKKTLLIIAIASLFISCNLKPSKEARIQKLEAEIQMTFDKVENLEERIQKLEIFNEQLKASLKEKGDDISFD